MLSSTLVGDWDDLQNLECVFRNDNMLHVTSISSVKSWMCTSLVGSLVRWSEMRWLVPRTAAFHVRMVVVLWWWWCELTLRWRRRWWWWWLDWEGPIVSSQLLWLVATASILPVQIQGDDDFDRSCRWDDGVTTTCCGTDGSVVLIVIGTVVVVVSSSIRWVVRRRRKWKAPR